MSLIKPPPCIVTGCGKNAAIKIKTKNGDPIYRNYCDKHHRMRSRISLSKKHYCENQDGHLGWPCTSTIIDSCQLQVDHIDGDRYNDDASNKSTICANCHSLKTKLHGNHSTRYQKHADSTFESLFTFN